MEYLSVVHIFINCQDFYIIGDTRRHAHLWQDSMNNKKNNSHHQQSWIRLTSWLVKNSKLRIWSIEVRFLNFSIPKSNNCTRLYILLIQQWWYLKVWKIRTAYANMNKTENSNREATNFMCFQHFPRKGIRMEFRLPSLQSM